MPPGVCRKSWTRLRVGCNTPDLPTDPLLQIATDRKLPAEVVSPGTGSRHEYKRPTDCRRKTHDASPDSQVRCSSDPARATAQTPQRFSRSPRSLTRRRCASGARIYSKHISTTHRSHTSHRSLISCRATSHQAARARWKRPLATRRDAPQPARAATRGYTTLHFRVPMY